MKKYFILLFLVPLVICITGCEKFISFDYRFTEKYDAVYCFIPDKKEAWIKDTTICFSRDDLRLLPLWDWEKGIRCGKISLGLGTLDNLFRDWQCDTVSFFIFDKDSVDRYPWEEIVKNYCVLQRYDFSKEDLKRLNCQIYYPPTKEMAGIHMYPRYESTMK